MSRSINLIVALCFAAFWSGVWSPLPRAQYASGYSPPNVHLWRVFTDGR